MANRDEILMNFQAITGMEDIPVCLDILEQKNWDLVAALASVMPQEDYSQFENPTSNGPSTSTSNGPVRSSGYVTEDGPIDVDAEECSRACTLGVYFGERLLRLELPRETTLAELKQRLGRETQVPPTEQVLSGWPESMLEVEDQMTLGQLNISGDIYHIRMDHQPLSDFPTFLHPHSLSDVTLHEHDSMNKSLPPLTSAVINHRTTYLCMNDVAHSDIRSMSVGPGSLDDQVSSQGSGEVLTDGVQKRGEFSGGSSELVVGGSSLKLTSVFKPIKSNETVVVEVHGSSSESEPNLDDEFEADDEGLFADDDAITDPSMKAMKNPLVPEDCTEPYEVLQCFTHSFELRYGSMHPLFLLGSLAEAVAEATSPSASSRTRKPMCVYLHHDGSVLSNVFCSQLLCDVSVINCLSLNFITWAWDLTAQVHKIKLLKMVEESFGSSAKANVDEIRADHLPVILIAFKENGSVNIKNIIQGEANLDSLMTSLLMAVEENNIVIEKEIQEENKRAARKVMIAEQNRAYEESLQADREKERKKMEQMKEEEMERLSKEAKREAMSQNVLEEPSEDCQEKICTLRIRFPDGEVEQRRFLAIHTLKDVINFMGSKNYMASDYKILTSFPRKDLTEQNFDLSLEELKLCPQETVFIEERT